MDQNMTYLALENNVHPAVLCVVLMSILSQTGKV